MNKLRQSLGAKKNYAFRYLCLNIMFMLNKYIKFNPRVVWLNSTTMSIARKQNKDNKDIAWTKQFRPMQGRLCIYLKKFVIVAGQNVKHLPPLLNYNLISGGLVCSCHWSKFLFADVVIQKESSSHKKLLRVLAVLKKYHFTDRDTKNFADTHIVQPDTSLLVFPWPLDMCKI